MTPAEMKTAHEALGVSTEFIARRVGVHSQMIWRYESADRGLEVPTRAAKVMRELQAAFDAATDRLTAEAQADGEAILRYRSLDEFYANVPELAGWGMTSQGLLLAEVQRRVRLPIDYTEAVTA